MQTRTILFTFIVFLLPFVISADEKEQLLKTKMLSDLDIIQNVFEVRYAPYEWKHNYAQWTLEGEISKAKNKVLDKENISIHDYQRILTSFFNSTRDYHVGITFYNTALSFLPFGVREADGRYFISWVSRKNTSATFSVGDEILTFDNKPISEVIAEIKATELGNPESQTDQARAEMILTTRIAATGREVASGPVKITLKPKNSAKIKTYNLTWTHVPEEINNNNVFTKAAAAINQIFKSSKQTSEFTFASSPIFKKQMIAPYYKTMASAFNKIYGKPDLNAEPGDLPEFVGAKKSFVPMLGKIIWQNPPSANFHAYTFLTPTQKKVGYVRISDYIGGGTDPKVAAMEFQELIGKFQRETDALIIDEVSNPGGYLFYMYALLSMVADKPLDLFVDRETITQQEVMFAIDALNEFSKYSQVYAKADAESAPDNEIENINKNDETIEGYPITPELIENMTDYFRSIIDEWNSGNLLTSPLYFFGIPQIKPHAQHHYTKPLLVLVNELSFSCGDFFPAVLQDNKRATIFGTRTAGAGGVVLGYTHSNRFGIAEYHLTGSIAERLNKEPIENLGVTPDIIYKPTAKDLQSNYSEYREAVLKAVDGLFQK